MAPGEREMGPKGGGIQRREWWQGERRGRSSFGAAVGAQCEKNLMSRECWSSSLSPFL